MPKIPNLLEFGKHCHNCGKWMQRRALRKDVECNFCNGKIFARNCKQMQLCSRCVECDNIILDNFNYCECCGLETNRQLRITKARALSNLFPKSQAAPDSSAKSLAASTMQPDKSKDLFDDFQIDNEELKLIEESLVTDDVSSDKENKSTQLQESLLTDVSLEKEEKKNILNSWLTTSDKEGKRNKLKLIEESLVTDDVSSDKDNKLTQLQESLLTDVSLETEEKKNILNSWLTTSDKEGKENKLTQLQKSLLTDVSLEKKEKEY